MVRDRNAELVVEDEPEEVLLPTLSEGVVLLDVDGGRGVPVLQSLVLDHLLLNSGPAFWVDSQGCASTTSLARIAPSRRLLEQVNVARGFTAFQHFSAVSSIPDAVNRFVREASSNVDSSCLTPSLIVAPLVDALYDRCETLGKPQISTLHARTLARLSAYAEAYNTPVLVTRSKTSGLSEAVERAADRCLQCRQTRMGPRFVGEEFESLVYPVDGGRYLQTTFAYWRHVLRARAEQVGESVSMPSIDTDPAMTVNPLQEAWQATGRGR